MVAGGAHFDLNLGMVNFLDNYEAWHSQRVNERELSKVLAQLEARGCEIKFVVPYRIPCGGEPGDAMYVVVVRDAE